MRGFRMRLTKMFNLACSCEERTPVVLAGERCQINQMYALFHCQWFQRFYIRRLPLCRAWPLLCSETMEGQEAGVSDLVPSNPTPCYPPALLFLQANSGNAYTESQHLLHYPHDRERTQHPHTISNSSHQICFFLDTLYPLFLVTLPFITGSPLNFLHRLLLFQSSFRCRFSVTAFHDTVLSLIQGAVISALSFTTLCFCHTAGTVCVLQTLWARRALPACWRQSQAFTIRNPLLFSLFSHSHANRFPWMRGTESLGDFH